MLSFIDIHNVAVIEHAQIEFFDGLNVLTGETGAGKSIIIDAIGMVLGKRTSRDIIRSGQPKATVNALFYISDATWEILQTLGIEKSEDGALMIYRELSADGKGVCRINSIPVPVSLLREVGKYLINIHGQQDTAELYSAEKHITLLDGYANDEIASHMAEYAGIFSEYRRLKSAVENAAAEEFKLNSEIDLISYQIAEISALNLKKGEADELEKNINLLGSAEQISLAAGRVRSLLTGDNVNVRDSLSVSAKEFSKIADINEETEKICTAITDSLYKIDDILSMIEELEDKTDFDGGRLDLMQERLYEIRRLSAKYKCSADGLTDFLQNAQEKLEMLHSQKNSSLDNENKLKEITEKLTAKAVTLTEIRKKYAAKFEKEIVSHLCDLNMKGVRFEVSFKEDTFTGKGADNVEFLISANPGEELKPLAKIASGGELSRIMLALKSIIAEYDTTETYIFDEIDTGISGITAEKVADKLISVARNNQTVIITHSPHIASIADYHYLIKKEVTDERTETKLTLLTEEGRIAEIARINSGSHLTDAALIHAGELLKIRRTQKDG